MTHNKGPHPFAFPCRLPLPHPIYRKGEQEVCLFVKDIKGEGHTVAKELHRQMQGTGISKIIGASKLRTKYESYESKRLLCSSYDLFLTDDRILPILPKLIGKSFFKKKKQPIPVTLSGSDWGGRVTKALGATYLYHSQGCTLSIRFSTTGQTDEQGIQNLTSVLEQACEKLGINWTAVQSVYLKTIESAALPIYQTTPDNALKIELGKKERGGGKDDDTSDE